MRQEQWERELCRIWNDNRQGGGYIVYNDELKMDLDYVEICRKKEIKKD